MLLRSSSTPILKASVVQSSAAAADSAHRLPSKPISLTASPVNKIQRTSSDGNMRDIAIPKRQKLPSSPMWSPTSIKEEGTDHHHDHDLFSLSPLSLAAGGGEDDGGDVGGLGGGAEGFGGDWGQQRMDKYYQTMINAYPGETLFLTNYARFLKDVQGDLVKAEEYCMRAVTVEPDDGEILSMYGDLIWSNHGDVARAQPYFDRAVQASPDDCNVIASYARYLWTAEQDQDQDQEKEEEEEKEGKRKMNEYQLNGVKTYEPHPHVRFTQERPYLAAASY